MDWKAITIGFIATLIIGLIVQMVYVLVAALIGAYSTSMPAIAPYKQALWLGGALFSFATTMFMGGAITMMTARTRRLINPLIACTLASAVSVATLLGYGEFTLMGVFLMLAGALFAILGGYLVMRWDSAKPPLENGA